MTASTSSSLASKVTPPVNRAAAAAQATVKTPKKRDRLRAGESLHVEESLVSKNGRYRLILQTDGNLVLYMNGNNALWSTETFSKRRPTVQATVHSDGNFVMWTDKGLKNWESATAGFGDETTMLVVQDDGNLVIYADRDSIWRTGTVQD